MKEINEKLIEKISEAVGVICDPYGLKKGQREFTRILIERTANREDISLEEQMDIIQEYRFLLSKNKNRRTILKKAYEHLNDDAEPSEIDNSWIFNFWDKSGTISDEKLQDIWAKVLASEVNNPYSISKRLLHNLSLMSNRDAENFSNLARFCFDDYKDDIAHPLIFIKDHSRIYAKSRITTNMLKELELFSLIETNYETGFAFEKKKVFTYKNHIIEVEKDRIDAGNVRLTEDGQRLYKIIGKREHIQILEYTHERLEYRGCNIKLTKDESKFGGSLF